MPDIVLSEIDHFLERYRAFTSGEVDGQVDALLAGFERLRDGFVRLQKEVLEEARTRAPAFNVFQLLGLSRYETRTHSAMLAHLLQPDGSHGQQHLFLEAFLARCRRRHQDFPRLLGETSSARWQVSTELVTPDGRLDIVLRCPELSYLCVIENKVDAYEQTDQLLRYGRWLKSQAQEYPSQALVFLTVHGNLAYTAQDTPHYPLSYHQDISAWLEETLAQIQAPNVLEVVRQYLELVRRL